MQKVSFKLEGDPQEYILIYDFNTVCDVEEKTGLNLMTYFGRRSAAITRAMLLALLLPNHHGISGGKEWAVTLTEAGNLLTKDIAVVTGYMTQAINLGDDWILTVPRAVADPILAKAGGEDAKAQEMAIALLEAGLEPPASAPGPVAVPKPEPVAVAG
jgi:hypothetical protein